jgi:hypothetical protein
MAEKSSPGTRQTDGINLVRFGEIERQLAYLYLPFFLFIILWYLPTVGWKVHCGIVGVQLNAADCFLSAAAQQYRPVCCTAVQLAADTVAVVPQLRSWSRSAYILAHMSHFQILNFSNISLQKTEKTPSQFLYILSLFNGK